MADGFLSPDGVFYSKEETYHAETARRILNAGKDVLEPIQELLRQGYIAFIEFRIRWQKRVCSRIWIMCCVPTDIL